jgi:riboflavin synthase
MFTGIVEETGRVESFTEEAQAWRLVISGNKVLADLGQGDSIAVNGCCLTAVAFGKGRIAFDLLGETVRLTNFHTLGMGSLVNLEGSLRVGGKIGGHFVTGHIDCVGTLRHLEPRGKDFYAFIDVPAQFRRYLAYKGSIAIDGISLTVAEVTDTGFAVWLIPHTMEVTNLHTRKKGDLVNLECDMLAKYVERLTVFSSKSAD